MRVGNWRHEGINLKLMKSLSLEPATIEDIFEISMSSAMCQEKKLMIFEKSDMTQISSEDRAERVR